MKESEEINIRKYIPIIIIGIVITISLFVVNSVTVIEVKATAPCYVIQSDNFEIPKNVITKGYDIIRDDDNNVIDEVCYYIKASGIIERTYYNWQPYQ